MVIQIDPNTGQLIQVPAQQYAPMPSNYNPLGGGYQNLFSSDVGGYGYTPSAGSLLGATQGALNAYYQQLPGIQTQLPQDLAAEIQAAPTYQSQDYMYAPLNYQAPAAYQATQYQMPEIADIQNVQPVSDQVWGERGAAQREQIGSQYGDINRQIQQAATQTQGRPEQIAALLAGTGAQQQAAQAAAQRDIDIQRAQQAVGIAQQTQSLAAQRAAQQAQLGLTTQEQQAAENQAKYGADVTAAQYQAGLEQARREAQQAEYQRQQQSRYGNVQDTAQTQMAQWQAQNAAYMNKMNAYLQGQQAQSQVGAQGLTYETNLTQQERDAMINARNAAQPQRTPQAPQTQAYKAPTYAQPKTGPYANIDSSTSNYAMPQARAA